MMMRVKILDKTGGLKKAQLLIAGSALLLGMSVSAAGWAADTKGMSDSAIFMKLLEQPDNVALNIAYAERKIEKGDLEKAREALLRALAADPKNETVRKMVAKLNRATLAQNVEETRLTLKTEATYESNARRYDSSFAGFDDTTARLTMVLDDQRQLSDTTWKSRAIVYKGLHNRWREGDLLYTGVSTGPVLSLGDMSTLHIAPKFAYTQLESRAMSYSYGIDVKYNVTGSSAFDEMGLSATFDDYTSTYKGYQGPTLSVYSRYKWNETLTSNDVLTVRPRLLRRNGYGNEGAKTYNGASVRTDYAFPYSDNVIGLASLDGEVRFYEGKDPGENSISKRRDLYLKPEVGVRWLGVLPGDGTIGGRVNYSFKTSNDQDKKYRGLLIGISSQWQF